MGMRTSMTSGEGVAAQQANVLFRSGLLIVSLSDRLIF
jgi:hypothetical protein